VDASNAFYLLNPSGDLEATQASFEHWFRSQKGWQVSEQIIISTLIIEQYHPEEELKPRGFAGQ
jgi:hypothetical protein